jgi:hypothetical protein
VGETACPEKGDRSRSRDQGGTWIPNSDEGALCHELRSLFPAVNSQKWFQEFAGAASALSGISEACATTFRPVVDRMLRDIRGLGQPVLTDPFKDVSSNLGAMSSLNLPRPESTRMASLASPWDKLESLNAQMRTFGPRFEHYLIPPPSLELVASMGAMKAGRMPPTGGSGPEKEEVEAYRTSMLSAVLLLASLFICAARKQKWAIAEELMSRLADLAPIWLGVRRIMATRMP